MNAIARSPWLAVILVILVGVGGFAADALCQKAAATGRVFGTVKDQDTGNPVPFATVTILRVTRANPEGESAGTVLAGEDGSYELEVAPGNYHFRFSSLSHQPLHVDAVFVQGGKQYQIDAGMRAGVTQLEAFKVEGKALDNTEGSVITTLKKESAVADAITSEQISRGTDSDAAEAVSRMAGVTVVGGKYVFVRGLGDRYSQTTVNGVTIGSPEPNRRTVPMDVFPSGMLDNIIVQKTYTPDMEGEFASAVVKLNTKDAAEKMYFKQTLGMGVTERTTGNPYLAYSGGRYDFLGFDDGTRALPDQVAGQPDFLAPGNGYSREELALYGKSFNNIWTPNNNSKIGPNYKYAGTLSYPFEIAGRKAGALASVSLSNSFRTWTEVDRTYRGSGGKLVTPPLKDFTADASKRDVLAGGTGNFTLPLTTDPDRSDRVKLNVLYTRSAEDKSRYLQGLDDNRGSHQKITQLSYFETSLFATTLQANHELGFLDSAFDWIVGYSDGSRSEPDRREYTYEMRNEGQPFTIGDGGAYPLSRIFGQTDDYERTYKLNWGVPIGPGGDYPSMIKTGFSYRNKDKYSGFRRFGFTDRRGSSCSECPDPSLQPEQLLSPTSFENAYWYLEELTKENDIWSADQEILAGYLMADYPLSSKFQVMAGARYEANEQNVEVKSIFVNTPTRYIVQSDYNWLPSVNLTYRPRRDMNVRAGWSMTLNRPQLRELSPFDWFNFETGYTEVGNGDLVTADIRNYDLRWEYYPGPGELISFGTFYKDFNSPLQKFVNPTVTGYRLSPFNGTDGNLYGFEVDGRMNLGSAWEGLDWALDLGPSPDVLRYLSLTANYSRIYSAVTINEGNEEVTNRFTGQSSYSANAGLFLETRRVSGSVAMSAFGKRISAFALGRLPNILEYPPTSLDLTLGYDLSASTSLKLSGENILDAETQFKQGNEITQAYKRGSKWGLSISYTP